MILHIPGMYYADCMLVFFYGYRVVFVCPDVHVRIFFFIQNEDHVCALMFSKSKSTTKKKKEPKKKTIELPLQLRQDDLNGDIFSP
jgi:hypothetical protein